jgi:hypothetical protein
LLDGLGYEVTAALLVLPFRIRWREYTDTARATILVRVAPLAVLAVLRAADTHRLAAVNAAGIAVVLVPTAARVFEDASIIEGMFVWIEIWISHERTEIARAIAGLSCGRIAGLSS